MREEKLRILAMIKDGTLSPEEGLDLLEALESSRQAMMPLSEPEPGETPKAGTEEETTAEGRRKPRYLYIKVDDQESGKKVNIRIPITLAKFAGKFIPKHARHEMAAQGVDLDLQGIIEQLEKEGPQSIIEVTDGDKKIVRIYSE
jgi:DUF4097 and DUF4098 domain-containing protein YvlB